jgi:hypothetical protein
LDLRRNTTAASRGPWNYDSVTSMVSDSPKIMR